MGCTQSKIENEETVTRCKDRKLYMKEAVSARNAFAAAHSSYSVSLKNTGAALSDFAHSHLPPSALSSTAVPTELTSLTSSSVRHPPSSVPLPPPPPPLPNFSTYALQRASSMPEMKVEKPPGRHVGPSAIAEESEEVEVDVDIEEEEDERDERLVRRRRRGDSGSRSSNKWSGNSKNESGNSNKWSGNGKNESGSSNKWSGNGKNESGNSRFGSGKEKVSLSAGSDSLHQDSTWDYFFPPMESVPGPTLADPVPEKKEKALERVLEAEDVEEGAEEEEEGLVVEVIKEKVAPAAEKKLVKCAGEGEVVVGRRVVGLNLIQIFIELDELFLKTSESAHEVSKMLEATRLHYHSNFADNRGHIDHSAIVMRVITWNRSIKGLPDVDDAKVEFDSEENETHATVLDKMLAWEKKLYDEVKVYFMLDTLYVSK